MFDWASLTPYGLVSLVLGLVFLAVIRGDFIPRKSHEREIAAERRVSAFWEQVAGERQVTITALSTQNTAMLETTKTTEALVKALPVPSKGE